MAVQLITNFRKPHPGIIQEPDKRLRTISEPVTKIDNLTKEISEKLIQVLKEVDKPFKLWLGMAAPQVGFNKRIVAIKNSYHNYLIMINPEIVKQAWLLPTVTTCHSLPGLYVSKSHYWFKIKYQSLDGKYHQKFFSGGKAVMIQQEIDHLNGKLACD